MKFSGKLFAALAIAFGVGIGLTRGTGALVAAGLGLAVLALRVPLGAWWTRHRRGMFIGAWATVILGSLAVVGHGLWHDTLPHASWTNAT